MDNMNNGNTEIESTTAATEEDRFPLNDAAIEYLAELDQQEKQIAVAKTAILGYFLRQQKISGNWALAENKRELVRTNPAQKI